MRKLTLYPRMGQLDSVEEIINSKLPEDFKNFLVENGGLSHYERIFIDKEETNWEVNSYVNYKELVNLTTEFSDAYKRKLIPFAFDPGGWHFCLCLDEGNDKGKIIINRWTDHAPEEQFLIIADSFEEFINGLKKEDEIS